MPISVSDLAKKLEIAPEAVILHAMDLDFDIPEDDQVPDDIARQIEAAETDDTVAQVEHEFEEKLDREIIEKQATATAGQKKATKKKKTEEPDAPVEVEKDDDGTIVLPDEISVRELSAKIGKPLPFVILQLKKNGMVANLHSSLDYDTSAVIATELGVKVRRTEQQLSSEDLFSGNLQDLLKDEDPEHLITRPPVISVMGHIDHGKTSLLDFVRQAKVVEGEAGGITQRIGAYQVKVKDEFMTFLDTPGHEAFTTMRARGARATDIAILVVAATEGLKPQSIEAINHAREAEIPIVVAINKMDLEGANPDLVKGQLAEHELTPADWGGDTPCLPISAKTGNGIDDLLETIQLIALEQKLRANPDRRAIATVIEATMDPRSGISATVLVNTGTLKQGDSYVVYDQVGKIRTMRDHHTQLVKVAAPSTPVQITGLSSLPRAGDILQVMESEKIAKKKADEVSSIIHQDDLSKRQAPSLAIIKARLQENKLKQLKVIAKADLKGTLEAVVAECQKVKTEQSVTKVVHSGVGEITESDVMLAAAGGAIIVAFATTVPGRIAKLADQQGVRILSYDVIYHLGEEFTKIIEGREDDDKTEEIFGRLKIKQVFASNRSMAVLGGEVIEGLAKNIGRVRLWREAVEEEKEEAPAVKEEKANKREKSSPNAPTKTEIQAPVETPADAEEDPNAGLVLVGQAKVTSLQRGSDEVGQIEAGLECGVRLSHNGIKFSEGDQLEFFLPRKK